MEFLLDHPWPLGSLTAILLAGVIEAGYQTAIRSRIQENSNRKDQMVAIRDGLFVLISLLLGFTLALSAPRYADRRLLLIDEVNAIGTSYLRAAMLPQSESEHAQELLRQYVDSRLEVDNAGLDSARRQKATERSKQIQEDLWRELIEVAKNDHSAVIAAYMTSLNQMIDIHEQRLSARENRIPRPVWLLIFSVSIIAVFTRGLTVEGRFWLTLILAPLTIAIVIALVADLDTPSSGLIRLDQRAMIRLQQELNRSR